MLDNVLTWRFLLPQKDLRASGSRGEPPRGSRRAARACRWVGASSVRPANGLSCQQGIEEPATEVYCTISANFHLLIRGHYDRL